MTNGRGHQKTRDELLEALQEQIGFLRSSCALYDEGAASEAARIATSIFALVNDGSSQSLLTLLGLRKSLEFVSYAVEPTPGNLLAEEPLVFLRVSDQGASCKPMLDHGPFPPKRLKFSHWWEREVVFLLPNTQKLDRKRLVFAMRNQDGGSHVDPRLSDETYITFSRDHRWTSQKADGSKSLPSPRAHHATMRHLGFELLASLQNVEFK